MNCYINDSIYRILYGYKQIDKKLEFGFCGWCIRAFLDGAAI